MLGGGERSWYPPLVSSTVGTDAVFLGGIILIAIWGVHNRRPDARSVGSRDSANVWIGGRALGVGHVGHSRHCRDFSHVGLARRV